jgi:hypothetical protein
VTKAAGIAIGGGIAYMPGHTTVPGAASAESEIMSSGGTIAA